MLSDILATLPNQFAPYTAGRTLILDGDFPAYQAAATVKTLPTAIRRFETLVETERFVTSSQEVQVHLTPSGSTKCRRYDYPTAKPYQANRVGKAKPPLLGPLRAAIPTERWEPHWSVHEWLDREADDGMMMHAVLLGNDGVVVSGDKDLRITPGPYWEIEEGRLDIIPDRYGWIKPKELSSSIKVIGHGTKFFWAQMLMGDTADNIQGLKRYRGALVGPAGAYQALRDVASEDAAANLVLRAYASINQDPLAEAQCLWLRRSNEDCAYRYLMELDLAPDLRAWIELLHQYHTEVLAIKASQKDQDRGETEPAASAGTEASGNPGGIDVPW